MISSVFHFIETFNLEILDVVHTILEINIRDVKINIFTDTQTGISSVI